MNNSDSENSYKLAQYQDKRTDGSVRCKLCPHVCLLQDGEVGICHARQNTGGTLYTLAYGNPCSVSIDPIEKKPLFHFRPGAAILSLATAGCNFHCLNCQNWQISQAFPDDFGSYRLSPKEVVETALSRNVKLIAFTYTEPTIFYEYMYDIAVLARKNGIKTVMVSNGFINPQPLSDLCPYLDAANVDLKCFDNAAYRQLTGGSLHPVMETLKTLKKNHVWLEITNLLIPGFNDDEKMIREMCKWLIDNGFSDTPLHFSRFFPTYKLNDTPPTPEKRLFKAKEIAEETGIRYVYIGNVSHTNGENTFCPACKNLLVERKGFSVTKNRIAGGKCSFCGEEIAGDWLID